jgi:hypothetical protein
LAIKGLKGQDLAQGGVGEEEGLAPQQAVIADVGLEILGVQEARVFSTCSKRLPWISSW